MTRRRKLAILAAVLIGLPAIGFVALRVLFPVHRDPPLVIGVEPGPVLGQSTRFIVFETRYRVMPRIPMCGSESRWDTQNVFYLQTATGRQDLPFLDKVLPDTVMSP